MTDYLERFMTKVDVVPGPLNSHCWIWKGGKWHGGYGQANVWGSTPRRNIGAHRYARTLFVAAPAPGLHLDHLCRIPACCNPWHVEPVTCKVNINRGRVAHRRLSTSECPMGHPYEGHNILWVTAASGNRARKCRICVYAKNEARRQRLRAAGVKRSR